MDDDEYYIDRIRMDLRKKDVKLNVEVQMDDVIEILESLVLEK